MLPLTCQSWSSDPCICWMRQANPSMQTPSCRIVYIWTTSVVLPHSAPYVFVLHLKPKRMNTSSPSCLICCSVCTIVTPHCATVWVQQDSSIQPLHINAGDKTMRSQSVAPTCCKIVHHCMQFASLIVSARSHPPALFPSACEQVSPGMQATQRSAGLRGTPPPRPRPTCETQGRALKCSWS